MRFQLDLRFETRRPETVPCICPKSHHHHFRFRLPIVIPRSWRIRSASVTSMEEYVRSNRARSGFSIVSLTSIRTSLSEALECQLPYHSISRIVLYCNNTTRTLENNTRTPTLENRYTDTTRTDTPRSNACGWGDPTCSTALCPNNCTHPIFGTCTNEQQEYGSNCKCEYGYKGKACDQHTGCGDLGRECDGNAYCVETTFSVQTEDEGAFLDIVTGECRCFAGWAGARCDQAVCPNNCTSPKNGICGLDESGRTQKCLCKDHHVGIDCARSEFCHLDCSHHGVCDKSTGTCRCDGVGSATLRETLQVREFEQVFR